MNTTDNKALADRLDIAAKIHEDIGGQSALAATIREAAAALSPQADKARGEVYCYPAWAHGECLEVLRNVDTQFRATGQASARIERLINLLAGIAPQPQGDGFTAADMMDARAEERARLSGSQVSGGGDDVFNAFDDITGLCRHLRQGGPAPEDLQGLSDGLDEAVRIAGTMLATLSTPQARPEAES